mmetsp:Transcript_99163/g.248616  ORF Transcript_99163/g.248616 Transcript_99163/m.248616 type:complete len:165 (+) Transcript_99163:1076-1570(+)
MHHSTRCDEESAAAGAEGAGEGKAVGCGSPGGGRNGSQHRPAGGKSSMRAGQDNPGGGGGHESSFDSGTESPGGGAMGGHPNEERNAALAISGEGGSPRSGLKGTPLGDEAALVLGVPLEEPASVKISSNFKLQGAADCAALTCFDCPLATNDSWNAPDVWAGR